ncbi:MAG: hypothetical protein HY908_06610 [Myxococcales bacterium]|nr:hypothetical protein [Myxococcales bacterium]
MATVTALRGLSVGSMAGVALASLALSFALGCGNGGPAGTDVPATRSSASASPKAPDGPRPEQSAAKIAPPPAGTPCDTLTAQGCIRSAECVLEAPDKKSGGPYVCRPAAGPCEGGIAQADPGFEADCRSRGDRADAGATVGGGCSLRPSECFCPNAVTKVLPDPGSPEHRLTELDCKCGGGPYRQCLRGK